MNTTSLQAKIEITAEKELKAELSSLIATFRQDIKKLTGMSDDTRVPFFYYANGVKFDVNPQLTQLLTGLEIHAATLGLPRRIERNVNSFISTVEELSSRIDDLQSQIQ